MFELIHGKDPSPIQIFGTWCALGVAAVLVSLYRITEHITLTHADLKATNTQENPDNVVPHSSGDATLDDGTLSARRLVERDSTGESELDKKIRRLRRFTQIFP